MNQTTNLIRLETNYYVIDIETYQDTYDVVFIPKKPLPDFMESYPLTLTYMPAYLNSPGPKIKIESPGIIHYENTLQFMLALNAAKDAANLAYNYVHEHPNTNAPEHFNQIGRTEFIANTIAKAQREGKPIPSMDEIIDQYRKQYHD